MLNFDNMNILVEQQVEQQIQEVVLESVKKKPFHSQFVKELLVKVQIVNGTNTERFLTTMDSLLYNTTPRSNRDADDLMEELWTDY